MLIPFASAVRSPTGSTFSVNPVVSSDDYTVGSVGNPATFDVVGSYAGSDTLTLYGVFGTSPITVSQAQLVAGSGGTNTLEFFSVSSFTFSGSFDISGLTSASEAANQLKYVVVEDSNGGTTGVLTAGETISGLDFTAPAFSSAEVGNVSDSTIVVTFDSALFGSTTTADWDVQVAGSPATESSVTFAPGATTVSIVISAAVTGGQAVTVAYNGTGLKDASDNDLATFTAQTVTNNVSATDFSAYNSPVGAVAPTLIIDFHNEVFAADTGSGLADVARDTLISNFSAYETVGGVQRMRLDSTDGDTKVATSAFNFSYTGGTIQVLGRYDEVASGDRIFQFDDDTDNADRIAGYFSSSSQLRGFVQDTSTTKLDLTTSTYVSDDPNGFAFSWADGDFAASFDGGAAVTSAGSGDGLLPTDSLTTLHIGNSQEANDHPGGGIQKLVYWNTQLADADVVALAAEGVDDPSLTATFLDAGTDLVTVATSIDLDFTGTAENDQIYILATKGLGTQTNGITALTVEGVSATLVGQTSSTVARRKCYVYKIACPAAAANSASATIAATGGGSWTVGAYKLSATPTQESVTANQYTTTTSPLVGSVNTVAGGVLLGIGHQENATSLTWTGATEDSEATVDSGQDRVEWVSAAISSSETPRTVTASHAGTNHGAIITVALS